MDTLPTIAWLVCGIYATIPLFWLIIHPFADFWRRRYRSPLKVLGLIWIALWIIAWGATAAWRQTPIWGLHTYRAAIRWSSLVRLAVIPLWATSLFIYFGGRRHFSLNQVIGRTELEPDRQQQILVTTGLHARMRHPLYFGHLCTMFGWLVLAPTAAVLSLLIWGILSGAFMIRTEDTELEQRFGTPYREYRNRVPAVIPRL